MLSLSTMCYNFTSALCVCVLLFMRMCASPFIALCVMVIVYFSSLNCCCGCLKTELYAKPFAHTNVMCVLAVCLHYILYMHMGDMSDVCNMGIANTRFARTCYNTACVRFKCFHIAQRSAHPCVYTCKLGHYIYCGFTFKLFTGAH